MRYPMPMCVCVRVCVFVCVCSQARCCSPHCYLCITPAGTLLLASRDGRAGLEACLSLLRAQRCLVEVGVGLGLGLGLGCLVEVGRKLIRKAPLLLTYYLPTHLPLTCSHHYSPGGPPLLHGGRPPLDLRAPRRDARGRREPGERRADGRAAYNSHKYSLCKHSPVLAWCAVT